MNMDYLAILVAVVAIFFPIILEFLSRTKKPSLILWSVSQHGAVNNKNLYILTMTCTNNASVPITVCRLKFRINLPVTVAKPHGTIDGSVVKFDDFINNATINQEDIFEPPCCIEARNTKKWRRACLTEATDLRLSDLLVSIYDENNKMLAQGMNAQAMKFNSDEDEV